MKASQILATPPFLEIFSGSFLWFEIRRSSGDCWLILRDGKPYALLLNAHRCPELASPRKDDLSQPQRKAPLRSFHKEEAVWQALVGLNTVRR